LTLDLPKTIKLKETLKIYNNNELLENIEYEKANKEHFINEIAIPTDLKFDARFIKTDNTRYILENVKWDIDDDKNINWQ